MPYPHSSVANDSSIMLFVLLLFIPFTQAQPSTTLFCDADKIGGFGPDEWWCNAPLCTLAPDQSPRPIYRNKAINGKKVCTNELPWAIKKKWKLFEVKNVCSSLKITPLGFDEKGKIIEFDTTENNIGRLFTKGTPFQGEYKDFCLDQIHFHWDNQVNLGSEHTLDGKRYPLEAHFVHFACKFGNIENAIDAGFESAEKDINNVDRTLAVIGLFFEISEKDNPAFDVILSDYVINQVKNCTAPVNNVIVNDAFINDMLPKDTLTAGYYTYKGGLTTPPCLNNVNWHVLETIGYISKRQLKRFTRLFEDQGNRILRNWRNLVPNNRKVTACMKRKKKKSSSDSKDSDSDSKDSKSSDSDSRGSMDYSSAEVQDNRTFMEKIEASFQDTTVIYLLIAVFLFTVLNIGFVVYCCSRAKNQKRVVSESVVYESSHEGIYQ